MDKAHIEVLENLFSFCRDNVVDRSRVTVYFGTALCVMRTSDLNVFYRVI